MRISSSSSRTCPEFGKNEEHKISTEMDMVITVELVSTPTIQISHYPNLIVPKSTKSSELGFMLITSIQDFVSYRQSFAILKLSQCST